MFLETIGEAMSWDLTPDEVPKFQEKAKEFGFKFDPIDVTQRPIRTLVFLDDSNRNRYKDFALSVRPHHQSDS